MSKNSKKNQKAVHAGWKLHYNHIRHSLKQGFYQGWDLHPAQLPARFAALYSFFLEGLDPAAERLKGFLKSSNKAALTGDFFDDEASGKGLLNYFLRAHGCGAILERDIEKTGLSLKEIQTLSNDCI